MNSAISIMLSLRENRLSLGSTNHSLARIYGETASSTIDNAKSSRRKALYDAADLRLPYQTPLRVDGWNY